ncbi:hypothetical protein UCD39_04520 [Nitrospirillum sp. BR 11752]|uniref:Uncharacterized protein n=1 Tax=Nitrospirillum amazonense TaxID=28077 RepID=A0A560GYN4_9PROT|nr:hypothetical protein [Nitrospirillum amazonense]MEE3623250.1 hypothetical protein [Nitrospirillum sp. BR 11752]TWB38604.1 hypothetical protein FBZ90_11293 [Nitrospirillum amazonense]
MTTLCLACPNRSAPADRAAIRAAVMNTIGTRARTLLPALLALTGLSFDQMVVLRAGLDMVLQGTRSGRFH